MSKDEAMKLTDEEIETKWFIDLDEACEALRRVEHHIANGGKMIEQPAQPEPVAFPTRKAVEREIERTANPTGMHLNDGKERVALPGGTLRHMLALIDRTSPPAPAPAQECKWPTCQREDYQQALAEQIKRELVGEQPAQQEPVGDEWTPCMKLPVVVHVRKQRPGEAHVSTREGITPVKPDDLIMRGVSGEEYPIGRAIFEQTYSLEIKETE